MIRTTNYPNFSNNVCDNDSCHSCNSQSCRFCLRAIRVIRSLVDSVFVLKYVIEVYVSM